MRGLTWVCCADVSGQQDMSKPVDIELVEVLFGEVELEAAPEVSDASFKLVPVEGCD